MSQAALKICYFPGRESTYTRTRVLLKGLKEAHCIVYNCSYHKRSLIRFFVGFIKFLFSKKKADVILIGFLGQPIVPFVKLFTRKPLILDAFISGYQTLCFERKRIKPGSLAARAVHNFEERACQMCDAVLLDTHQHIAYFSKEYRVDRRKFHRSFVGAEDLSHQTHDVAARERFMVHFHGEFQPHHGTKHIIEAAQLLPGVDFRLIGFGMEWKECRQLAQKLSLTNVEFVNPVSYRALPSYMKNSDVCLGIFGATEKAKLVIPCKIYDALSLGCPVVTGDTPAVRELLTHRKNVFLCEPANARDLSQAITTLRNQPSLRKQIAEEGRRTYEKFCRPKVIGHEIKVLAEKILARSV